MSSSLLFCARTSLNLLVVRAICGVWEFPADRSTTVCMHVYTGSISPRRRRRRQLEERRRKPNGTALRRCDLVGWLGLVTHAAPKQLRHALRHPHRQTKTCRWGRLPPRIDCRRDKYRGIQVPTAASSIVPENFFFGLHSTMQTLIIHGHSPI